MCQVPGASIHRLSTWMGIKEFGHRWHPTRKQLLNSRQVTLNPLAFFFEFYIYESVVRYKTPSLTGVENKINEGKDNQSINQSINQSSINQSINQSISQSIMLNWLVKYRRKTRWKGKGEGGGIKHWNRICLNIVDDQTNLNIAGFKSGRRVQVDLWICTF